MLKIVNDYSRFCPGQIVDVSIAGARVVRFLDDLTLLVGLPEEIILNKGLEGMSKAMFDWSERTGIRLRFIESFNGSVRDELLNEKMFYSLDDARRRLALWRYDYNNVRPHSSLDKKAPAEARWTLEQFEGSAPGALAQSETQDYENQTRTLSL